MAKEDKGPKKPLFDRIISGSKSKLKAATLDTTDIFEGKEPIPTVVPMINVALSGTVDGGVTPGLLTIAGPSKHFKTLFSILMASAFLKKNPDGYIIFYVNEFGSPREYFTTFKIPEDRVIMVPFLDIEELKQSIMTHLNDFDKKDKVMMVIDSIGNAASRKEINDALSGNEASDMTRAKVLKGVFRMITPHLSAKGIPMVAINHTYDTQETYSKKVVSGGTGIYYSSDNIWIIGRQQEKGTDKEITGYNFIINIEKSRFVKEKAKIPVNVTWEGGLSKWSGLFDVAMEAGYIQSPKMGWYCTVDPATGEVSEKNYRRAELEFNGEFWKTMLAKPEFTGHIADTYRTVTGDMIKDEDEELEDAV